MDFQEYKSAFEGNGFVVVPQFLIGDDLAVLTNNLERYIREIVPTLTDSDAFYQDKSRPNTLKQLQNMGTDLFFASYRKHPRWIALAETLLGEPVDAHEPEWFNKPPGTEHPTPPHQDNYYFNLQPPNALTSWVALDPVDEENGCLRYVVGSHLLRLRPHQLTGVLGFSQGINDYNSQDELLEVAIQLEPGDVAVHHCQTIHRADPNRSGTRSRRALAIVFQGASCRLDQRAHQSYLAAARRQHKSMGLKPEL